MPRIVRVDLVESIKPGDPSQVADDGTILNPVPYLAANIEFADGITVQIERPLTVVKIQDAHRAARQSQQVTIDEITTDQDIPP